MPAAYTSSASRSPAPARMTANCATNSPAYWSAWCPSCASGRSPREHWAISPQDHGQRRLRVPAVEDSTPARRRRAARCLASIAACRLERCRGCGGLTARRRWDRDGIAAPRPSSAGRVGGGWAAAMKSPRPGRPLSSRPARSPRPPRASDRDRPSRRGACRYQRSVDRDRPVLLPEGAGSTARASSGPRGRPVATNTAPSWNSSVLRIPSSAASSAS